MQYLESAVRITPGNIQAFVTQATDMYENLEVWVGALPQWKDAQDIMRSLCYKHIILPCLQAFKEKVTQLQTEPCDLRELAAVAKKRRELHEQIAELDEVARFIQTWKQ